MLDAGAQLMGDRGRAVLAPSRSGVSDATPQPGRRGFSSWMIACVWTPRSWLVANTLSPWPRAPSSEIPPSQRWTRVTATPRNWFSFSRRGRILPQRRAVWPCVTSARGCMSCPARSRSGKLGRGAVRAPHGLARKKGPTARRFLRVQAGWRQATERRPAATAPGRKRLWPACGARPRPTSSGQRRRPPCNGAAPAGLPGERRNLRLRSRSCRQSSRAKTSPQRATSCGEAPASPSPAGLGHGPSDNNAFCGHKTRAGVFTGHGRSEGGTVLGRCRGRCEPGGPRRWRAPREMLSQCDKARSHAGCRHASRGQDLGKSAVEDAAERSG